MRGVISALGKTGQLGHASGGRSPHRGPL